MSDVGVMREPSSTTGRSDSTLAARCSALVADAFDHRHHEPQPWLDALAARIAGAAGPDTLASIAIVEPIDGTDAWDTRLYALAGAEDSALVGALTEEAHAGFPSDDVASHAGHRGPRPRPSAAPRRALLADDRWHRSAYASFRRPLGLHEFARAVVPFAERDRPRTLLLQIDLTRAHVQPLEHHVAIPGVCAPAILRAYRRCFLDLAEHREAILERLTPAQRRILPHLVDGLSEAEVGRQVGRSAHTVHDHTKSIYQTLNVGSRLQLRDLWFGRRPDRARHRPAADD